MGSQRLLVSAVAASLTAISTSAHSQLAYSYQTLLPPGAPGSVGNGIDAAGDVVLGAQSSYGYLYSGGNYVPIGSSSAVEGAPITISPNGQYIGGVYSTDGVSLASYLLYNGSYTSFAK